MKPMLAATVTDLTALTRFPYYVSPKYDGIRALTIGGMIYSRSMKPIPNQFIQATFGFRGCQDLDGELIVGSPTADDVFNVTTSVVMSHQGSIANLKYYVFDDLETRTNHFAERIFCLGKRFAFLKGLPIERVPQRVIHTVGDLAKCADEWLAEGYEGMMIRDPHAMYKHGRSTLREEGLLKFKPFTDAEAEIVGFDELMRNANEATTSELGYQVRSTKQEGMVGGNTLGAFVCKWFYNNEWYQFNIGTGLTAAQRELYWENRDSLIGKLIKFKYQEYGTVDVPRLPVFLGFRDPRDK